MNKDVAAELSLRSISVGVIRCRFEERGGWERLRVPVAISRLLLSENRQW